MSRRRRISLGLMDQTLSSASNVLALFATARVSDVATFGVTALGFAGVTAALAVGRGCFGTPLLLLGAESRDRIDSETKHASAAAFLMGVVVGSLIMLYGALSGHIDVVVPLALATPLVLAQDVHRFSAMSSGHPERAVLWDSVWAVGSGALLVTTWAAQSSLDLEAVLFIWAGLAAVSCFGFVTMSNCPPSYRGLTEWLMASIAPRLRYGLEGGIGATSSLVVVSVAGIFVGSDAIAALRGAGSILGPLSILMSAIPVALLPETIRARNSPQQTWALLRKMAAAMSVAALVVGAIGFLLPDAAGELLLGSSWSVVAPLLPITGLEYTGVAWVSVMFSYLRAQGWSGALLRSRTIHAGISVVLSAAAALTWGSAISVAWSLAATAALAALLIRPALRLTGPGRT